MTVLKRMRLACLAGLAGVAMALASGLGPAQAADGKITVTWIAHATFEVVSPGGTKLLIDPFIANNPKTPEAMKDLAGYAPDVILVSHSHQDHSADVVAIAKQSGAKVIATSQYVRSMDIPQEQQMAGNPGGQWQVGDVSVHYVPAMHASAPDGRPVGFIVRFADGRSLYHTGDTWIFGDMALINEIFSPDIILLQAGGGPFNQDPATAALAIEKFFDPDVIIPMHYGTFPVLAAEKDVRAAFDGDQRVRIMQPGETAEF